MNKLNDFKIKFNQTLRSNKKMFLLKFNIFLYNVALYLKKLGYIKGIKIFYKTNQIKKKDKNIKIILFDKYQNKIKSIKFYTKTNICFFNKFSKKRSTHKNIFFLTTTKGIFTEEESIKQNIGGKFIFCLNIK